MNYCLPLISADKTAILNSIHTNLDDYKYFEVWLDYVEGVDEAFVKQLAELLEDRLVLTFRRQNLETPHMEPARRASLLAVLTGTPVFVDLDVETQKTDLDASKGLRLITSYHNYQRTPDTLQLERIIDTMKTYQPAIYKLSTLCETPEDAVKLLGELLKLKTAGLKAIVSGMGRNSSAVRIFGSLWGNEMVFAPLSSETASAPGQLTRQQLETIFKELV